MEARPGDGLEDDIGTAAARPDETTPPLQIVDVLRSAPLPLGDEDSFTALIEAANGHDDHFDPTDEHTVEAMESLLEKEVLRSGESPRAAVDARARNELWTHMAWGYRVGRYVLTTHGRTPLPPDPRPGSYVAPDLVSFVSQAHQRQEVVDLLTSAELNPALHYHPLSSTLCRACGGDKARARAWVRLVEDLGFLTALGAEDVTRGPRVQIGETRPQVVGVPAGEVGGLLEDLLQRPVSVYRRVRGKPGGDGIEVIQPRAESRRTGQAPTRPVSQQRKSRS